MISILLLAAGQSSRMGTRDKLLELIDGQPLLARVTSRALSVAPTYVTLPALNHPRAAVLSSHANVVAVPDAMKGMAASLCRGIAALPKQTTGVIIMPADMPDITNKDLGAILAHSKSTPNPIVRATTNDGKPGHPTYFSRAMFPKLKALKGDTGAAPICAAHLDETMFVPLQGNRARLDLDTPEDWHAYRSRGEGLGAS